MYRYRYMYGYRYRLELFRYLCIISCCFPCFYVLLSLSFAVGLVYVYLRLGIDMLLSNTFLFTALLARVEPADDVGAPLSISLSIHMYIYIYIYIYIHLAYILYI